MAKSFLLCVLLQKCSGIAEFIADWNSYGRIVGSNPVYIIFSLRSGSDLGILLLYLRMRCGPMEMCLSWIFSRIF